MRDYFTANRGRKIFFFGILATTLIFCLYAIVRVDVLRIFCIMALIAIGVGTLWDSMYSRYLFLKKVQEIQYEHLKEIADKQEAGEEVLITPTFSDEEKRYLRFKKTGFVFIIIMKVFLLIALFSLLLTL